MKILILGAGAIGSNLARILVPDLRDHEVEVLDRDIVEERNVTAGTQFYLPDQVGLPKVEALQFNLYNFYAREINIHHCEFPSGFTADIGRYDLAIDCFDNTESRQALQDEFRQRRILRDTWVELLHVGFSPSFTYAIEWDRNYTPHGDVKGVDICEMPGASSFVNTVASLAAHVVQLYVRPKSNKPRIELIGNQLQINKLR